MFLVVAGNIGAGKSSFVERYAATYGARPLLEAVAENPYLADFYADRSRWALASQVFFLQSRLAALKEAARGGDNIQDRSLYEDAEVFARNLHLEGSLDARDWATYSGLYNGLRSMLPVPDRVLYLRASVETLRRRIDQRGRAYEKDMPEAYLRGLNQLYEGWAQSFTVAPLVSIDTDQLDFVANEADFLKVARLVRPITVHS